MIDARSVVAGWNHVLGEERDRFAGGAHVAKSEIGLDGRQCIKSTCDNHDASGRTFRDGPK